MTTPTAQPDTTLEEDATAFYDAVMDFLRVYQFRDRDRICCHDISVTQCYALDVLGQRGTLTVNELAAELYLDKSTTSRVVVALERKRYLRRAPHPVDGRVVQLAMTRQGRTLHRRIREDAIAQEKRLLGDLDPGPRAAVTTVMRRLAGTAAKEIQAGGGSCCSVLGTRC